MHIGLNNKESRYTKYEKLSAMVAAADYSATAANFPQFLYTHIPTESTINLCFINNNLLFLLSNWVL